MFPNKRKLDSDIDASKKQKISNLFDKPVSLIDFLSRKNGFNRSAVTRRIPQPPVEKPPSIAEKPDYIFGQSRPVYFPSPFSRMEKISDAQSPDIADCPYGNDCGCNGLFKQFYSVNENPFVKKKDYFEPKVTFNFSPVKEQMTKQEIERELEKVQQQLADIIIELKKL